MLTIWRSIILVLLTLGGLSCSFVNERMAAPLPVADVPDLRERWIDACTRRPEYVRVGSLAMNWPELLQMLDTYHDAVVLQPRRAGELYFRVEDEQGHPLMGVQVEGLGISTPDPLAIEPNVSHQTATIDKEYHLKWLGHSIELKIRKRGYRSIYIAFHPQPPNGERIQDATTMLEEGFVLPPATSGGPIRIILPPALNWVPSDYDGDTYDSRDCAYYTPDRGRWPKTIAKDAPLIVSGTASKMVLAPFRGTYAVVDRTGKLIDMIQLDKGNSIGFRNQGRAVSYGGSGQTLPDTGIPYEILLYSTPVPRPPK